MAMRAFYNEIKNMKVKDLPSRLKPILTVNNMKTSLNSGVDKYYNTFIKDGSRSGEPILHICFGGMAMSYILALPEERRHLQHAREHGSH